MTGRVVFLVLFLIISLFPFFRAQGNDATQDDQLSRLIESIKPSIVAIGTFYFNDVPKPTYLGTGFVIRKGKRLVTNYHVLEPVIEKEKLPYLRIFHKNFPGTGVPAKIVAIDEFHDLAILEHTGNPLPALTLADSSTAKEGYRVLFTGYPIGFVLGLNPTTHIGIISGIAPLIKPSPNSSIMDGKLIRYLNDPYDIFQIDATALPGNSGSPVIRVSSGEVIGVINSVFVKGKKEHALTDPSGITYAIPINFILALEKSITPSQ